LWKDVKSKNNMKNKIVLIAIMRVGDMRGILNERAAVKNAFTEEVAQPWLFMNCVTGSEAVPDVKVNAKNSKDVTWPLRGTVSCGLVSKRGPGALPGF
jgi:hypothetical protein